MLNLRFEPLSDLFEPTVGDTKEFFKNSIVKDIRMGDLAGTIDHQLKVEFDPADGSDILIQKVDPENALGYSVFSDPSDYYQHLTDSLYEPSDEEILGAENG